MASKLTSFTFPNDIEAFFVEINLKGSKWLICCINSPRLYCERNKYLLEIIRKNYTNGAF